jgi:2'-5' RNA ligase
VVRLAGCSGYGEEEVGDLADFMRSFVALDIDDAIRRRIERFMEGVQEFAPDVRWVRPESLHVNLKFIGERPEEAVEQIKLALSRVASNPFLLSFRGFGFFPTAKSPRVYWIGIEADPELRKLAATIDDAAAALGIPKEDHAFSPHLTLARIGSAAPGRQPGDRVNRRFAKLQEKLGSLSSPDFGTMTAREFSLYESQTLREGARYTKIARYPLNS